MSDASVRAVALGFLLGSLAVAGQNADAPVEQAYTAIEQGRYREALGLFETLVEDDPTDVSALFGAGRALSLLGEHEEALEYFENTIAQAPHMSAARFHLARSLDALDQIDLAIDAYRAVLGVEPYHRGARYRLGRALLRAGRQEQAERMLRGYEPFRLWDHQVRLLEAMVVSGTMTPSDRADKTLALLRALLDGGDTDRAGRLLEELTPEDRRIPRFVIARARWLMLGGRAAEARTLLDSVMVSGVVDRDAVWLSAQLNVAARKKEMALADYERLAALWPNPPARVHQEIGSTYAVNGRLAEAVAYFEKAIATEPRLATAHADLALARIGLGQPDEAELHYRAALEIQPGLVSAQQGLASLLLERGELADAIEIFRDSVRRRPRDPALRKNLALALHRAGKIEEAEAEMRTARELESRR